MTLFEKKYRIESARNPYWNYGKQSDYFVTLCTKNLKNYFGEIIDGIIILSYEGMYVEELLKTVEEKFRYIELMEYAVLPNHIHAIFRIKNVEKEEGGSLKVETRLNASLPSTNPTPPGGITKHHNPMLHNNLSRVIRWFKGRCTHDIRNKINPKFNWQSRFFDRIIRNDLEYEILADFICIQPEILEINVLGKIIDE